MRTDLNAEGTGRDLLFSNPGAELPDVYLSKSVIFASEGDADQYSVVLTHPPGMREDETVRPKPPARDGRVWAEWLVGPPGCVAGELVEGDRRRREHLTGC